MPRSGMGAESASARGRAEPLAWLAAWPRRIAVPTATARVSSRTDRHVITSASRRAVVIPVKFGRRSVRSIRPTADRPQRRPDRRLRAMASRRVLRQVSARRSTYFGRAPLWRWEETTPPANSSCDAEPSVRSYRFLPLAAERAQDSRRRSLMRAPRGSTWSVLVPGVKVMLADNH
jgi:hypothetical protein